MSKFLANTKPFLEQNYLISDIYLNQFNLLDFGQNSDDYFEIYDSDSRFEKYVNAKIPKLPDNFQFSGHGVKTRLSCGKFLGVRSTKLNPKSTLELMFNTCNRISCPVCIRKSVSVKGLTITQKIRDYIWFCFINGVVPRELKPKHFTLNPFKTEHFKPDFSSSKNYYKSIKVFIDKYINPYLDASVVFYHHHRFLNDDKLELKEFGHFHVIGFGFMPHYDVFKKKHGFIYTNEGVLNTFADIYRVARYELSHVIYPVNTLNKSRDWTENEINYMRKNNEWLSFLGGKPKPIPKMNETKSLHSVHTYFYAGNLSPYRIRYVKCKKTNRKKLGFKKMSFKLPMRNIDTNDKMYEITDGIHFSVLDVNKKRKYYPLDEMIAKGLRVDKNMQACIFKSKLKFGRLYKQKYKLNWIHIKNFTINNKIVVQG